MLLDPEAQFVCIQYNLNGIYFDNLTEYGLPVAIVSNMYSYLFKNDIPIVSNDLFTH